MAKKAKDKESPAKKGLSLKFHLYSSPYATLLALDPGYTEERILFDDKNQPHKVSQTGIVFNQTAMRTYIYELKRYGHDTAQEEGALARLEAETETNGQTEDMNKSHITGFLFGELDKGSIICTSIYRADPNTGKPIYPPNAMFSISFPASTDAAPDEKPQEQPAAASPAP